MNRLLATALFVTPFLILPSRGIADPIRNLVVFGDGFSTNICTDVAEIWVESLAATLGADLYNYASAGATTSDIQEQINSMTSTNSTLYVVWAGANDLRSIPSGVDPADSIAVAVSNVLTAVRTLVDGHGARKVVVPNVPNLGIVPEVFGTDE